MKTRLGFVIPMALFPICAAGQSIADIRQGTHPAFTFRAADRFDRQAGIAVDLPAAEPSKGVALAADAPQWHCCELALGETFPSGRYKIVYSLYTNSSAPATVGLYYIPASGSHLQITCSRSIGVGQVQEFQTYFYATRPFARLGIKKMDKTAAVSQAVVRIVLTDLNQREYPRLEGYWTVLQYPAPWGLRSEKIETRLNGAHQICGRDFDRALAVLPDVEAWLDRRSLAAELAGQADYLLRAVRILQVASAGESARSVSAKLADVKNAIAAADTGECDAKLPEFQQSLAHLRTAVEKSLGGAVRPELATDIFTWNKAWSLVGVDGTFEYSEPSPYQRKFMELGRPADFSSTWTTNTYRGKDLTVIYSVLTPLVTLDLHDGKFRFNFMGDRFGSPDLASAGSGWFMLSAPGKSFLFVMNRRPVRIEPSPTAVVARFPNEACVGYVRIDPGTPPEKLASLARFYQRLLLRQPVECVQVQRGNMVEQTFEYIERPCDWPVKPVTFAPVPHLVMLSREASSRYHVKMSQAVQRAPAGWGFVAGAGRLTYQIPAVPRADTFGINVWSDESDAAAYKELRAQGCRTVRLICGAGSDDHWDWGNLEPLRRRLRNNLQWAKDAGGLKVGVEMHGNWVTSGLSGAKGFSDPKLLDDFIKRWTTTIGWCKDYWDVIGWFDLQNEPGIAYERESVKPYHDFMRKLVKALRPAAKNIPILVEACNDANPVGLQFWEDLGDPNVIVGFHDYWPHMFTHQRVVEPGDQAMPAVFYPSFMPMIEWTTPSWNNRSPNFYYWDRWKCDAICLPVYRLIIERGYRLDCGEYGVVGYAGQTSPRSGTIWLDHALQRYRRMGINHNVYGYTGGFTWNTPEFRRKVLDNWQKVP
jgi:hypothetical protein